MSEDFVRRNLQMLVKRACHSGNVSQLHYVMQYADGYAIVAGAVFPDGDRPLHAACTAPGVDAMTRLTVVEMLLRAGCDPCSRDREGRTVIHRIVSAATPLAILDTILEACPQVVFERDRSGRTVLESLSSRAGPLYLSLTNAATTALARGFAPEGGVPAPGGLGRSASSGRAGFGVGSGGSGSAAGGGSGAGGAGRSPSRGRGRAGSDASSAAARPRPPPIVVAPLPEPAPESEWDLDRIESLLAKLKRSVETAPAPADTTSAPLRSTSTESSAMSIGSPASSPVLRPVAPSSTSPATLRLHGTTSIPVHEHLICPLTLSVFQHPVVTVDGATYEYAAIRRWFAVSRANMRPLTSPKTNLPLSSDLLVPNRLIQALASEFVAWAEATEKLLADNAEFGAADCVVLPSSAFPRAPSAEAAAAGGGGRSASRSGEAAT